jgi:hypothetical protein
MKGEKLRRQKRKALRAAEGDRKDNEEWEDSAWASNPKIAGLMARTR